MSDGIIWTRPEAAAIVELFEDILDICGITVPSPEDSERTPENEARLYGSVYLELLDNVEDRLIDILKRSRRGETFEPYIFPGAAEIGEQRAWKLGAWGYLVLQSSDIGYDYTIYGRDFALLDGGRLDVPGLTAEQALNSILKAHGLDGRSLSAASYEEIVNNAEAAESI